MIRYRPFLDGPWRLAMGIKALDLQEWIEIDERFAAQLAVRRQLLDEERSAVLAGLPESGPGQRELLALLLDHLPQRFPEHYRRVDGAIENLATGERFALAAWDDAPLELAGRLVQEDLCLMQRGDAGYRLVAAVLCFPAHWRLADKLGRPLQAIHEPVPGLRRTPRRSGRSLFREHPGGAAGVAAQLEPGGRADPVPAARASRQPAADQRRARRQAAVAPGRTPDAPPPAALG